MKKKTALPILIFILLINNLGIAQTGPGEEIAVNSNEAILAMHYSLHKGIYNIQGPYFNMNVLFRDEYNSNKFNISASGIVTFAPLFLSLPFIMAQGDTTGNSKLRFALYSYIAAVSLFNCQHHLVLKDFNKSIFQWKPRMSVFISSRTDWFVYHPKKWLRYKYGFGAQFMLYEPESMKTSYWKGIGVEVGIEKPYDFVDTATIENGFKFFIGLKSLSF